MEKLIKLLKNIKTPEMINNDDGDTFEKELKEYFKTEFKEMTKKDFRKLFDNEKWDLVKEKVWDCSNKIFVSSKEFGEFPDGTFIYQPFGTHKYPDFIFLVNDKIVPVEAKSSNIASLNSAKPTWNSGIPKDNGIYVFVCNHKGITYFLGNDVVDDESRKIMNDFWTKAEALKTEAIQKLAETKNDFGFAPYIRKMYLNENDVATNNKQKSYFENAIQQEQNVINMLNKSK